MRVLDGDADDDDDDFFDCFLADDNDIFFDTDTDTISDYYNLTRNNLTRSDCLNTLTNSMIEDKSVTIARNEQCRKFTQHRPLKVELRYCKDYTLRKMTSPMIHICHM